MLDVVQYYIYYAITSPLPFTDSLSINFKDYESLKEKKMDIMLPKTEDGLLPAHHPLRNRYKPSIKY